MNLDHVDCEEGYSIEGWALSAILVYDNVCRETLRRTMTSGRGEKGGMSSYGLLL